MYCSLISFLLLSSKTLKYFKFKKNWKKRKWSAHLLIRINVCLCSVFVLLLLSSFTVVENNNINNDMSSPTAAAADIDDDNALLWNEIVAAFREDGFTGISKNINGAIREELLSIYKSFFSGSNASSKFVIAWEAFVSKTANIKDDVKAIPSVENIESFREYVLREDLMAKEIKGLKSSTSSSAKSNSKKKLSKFERQVQKKARVMMSMGDHLEMHDEDVHGKMEVVGVGAASTADAVDGNKDEDDFEPVLKTPFKETNNASTSSLPASIAAQMKTPGSYRKAKKKTSLANTTSSTLVKTIFEGALGDFNASETSSSKEAEISFSELVSSASQGKLFMRDRIEDKVALLKNKFVPFNNNNNKEEGEGEGEGEGDEQQQTTTTTTVVGRVCCDSSDRQELQLESSDGSRVKLELRSVENEYSLFPGQIVRCVGANPTGYCFVAKEIDCYHFKQEKEHESPSSSSSSFSPTEMLVFSGPFTANDDLMYEPLDDVLHEASSSKNPASVVLLMGPFVSDENINHALASNITFKQAFEQIVMKKIEAFAKQYPNKHVVLVPSVKDAFHRYCAFPQMPFNHSSSKCKNIHFVANPSAFEVNGIRVAVSTCDVLKHLSGFERGGKGKNTDDEEKKPQQTDRMTRLCSHLVGQKSMYPLFPPHPDARFESHDAMAPLRVGMDERIPDLIVLTSDLAAGGWKNALSGNKTMFVNPGKVCRGVNAGTFCKVSYSGSKEKSSSFAESARLELHKL